MLKEPITDLGKKLKKGRLTLEYDNGQWSTTQEGTGDPDKVGGCVSFFLGNEWTWNYRLKNVYTIQCYMYTY